jgi:hypothetical protein
MALYDTIRKNYAQTRRSDPRIAKKILETLASSPATIADILAGKRSYAHSLAEFGYHVSAIEPSVIMNISASNDSMMSDIVLFTVQPHKNLMYP